MYRILAADQPVRERRNQREHPQYTKPELVATAPNQTWSWDITKLLGPTKWTYFYLYVVLDIFSRYAVGWMVADRENSALAGRLIEETCHKQGVQPQVLTLHSDRGAPMTSKCTAQLLADLGVTRSLSRPQVSDDNPFSEAQFKTLKYHPGFPGRFHDITAAIAFCRTFFPLVQHRTSPWRDRDAHPGRRPSQSNPERAGAARADPSSRLDPSSRTLRSRDPTTGSPSPSRLDQPTCDTHNRRNCSVNRNRHCLKVVDRFRGACFGLADSPWFQPFPPAGSAGTEVPLFAALIGTMARSDCSNPFIIDSDYLLSSAAPVRRPGRIGALSGPLRGRTCVPGFLDAAGPSRPHESGRSVLPSAADTASALRMTMFRRSIALPARAATDTSHDTSRCPAHGSRRRRLVTPFLPPDFHRLSTSELA